MKQLVLTGHIGQNPRYPVSQLAQFIVKRKQHRGKTAKGIEQELLSVLRESTEWGGFILLDLDEENKLQGLLVTLPGEPGEPAELAYLAASKKNNELVRKQLMVNGLKISRGIILVKCDLSASEEGWLQEIGYFLDRSAATIQKKGG